MKIRCVVCRTGSPPAVETLEDTLEAFQAVVGGCIEGVGIGPGLTLYCNEDGLSLGLPRNRCGILGDFLICGSSDLGDCVSVTPAEEAAILAWCAAYEAVKHRGAAVVVESFESLEAMLAARDRARYDADHAN